MREAISNLDDVIDSRDVIKRIETLTDERDGWPVNGNEDPTAEQSAAAWAADNEDDAAELASLLALQSEAEGSPDWKYGEGLIRYSHFEDYARELADDIGAVSKNATWPNQYIDWEAAAEALQQDYFEVDFDGVTYWIRS